MATIGSHSFQDHDSWGYQALARLCYRPGHGTECCSGAIHKMMPLYLKRMWLQRGHEIVAALHGPSTAQFVLGNGRRVTVEAETPLTEKTVTLAATGQHREILISRPAGTPAPKSGTAHIALDMAGALLFDRATGERTDPGQASEGGDHE